MNEYVESIFNIFTVVKEKARENNDRKMQMISLIIYNYILKTAKENDIAIPNNNDTQKINLLPFFEYISHNNIELYDFKNIKMEDLDITKNSDLERFVLTHIYYITQKME
jgi:hypothetical protein